MKPQYDRDSETAPTARPVENHSTRERGLHGINAGPPPPVPYRRYPSLSDDGQPYFPRLRRARRSADKSAATVNSANESRRSSFFSVRTFALLALIAIIVALAARA